jgi:uncharacterized membrane protein (DUF4010 family)
MFETFHRLGLALGFGLLVGLQRQRTDARLAGFRTFPLVALFGALCGLLATSYGSWIVAAGLAAVALVMVGGNLPLLRVDSAVESPGVTTEIAMLVMFALGAYAMIGSTAVAIVTCGAVVVLLHLKPQLHSLAQKIGDQDFRAVMQFTLISLVILPVLPNREFGPFLVLNPFKIWLMVVLIVGVSLGGYVAYKFIGLRRGAWLNGVLGGLVSSTATTVSVARSSRHSAGRPEIGAFVIVLASGVVFLRVGILIGATAPAFFREAVGPLLFLFATLALVGGAILRGPTDGAPAMPIADNPTELKSALLFGVLYAVVLLATAAANARFGAQGLYVAAAISGLSDMDAITLSVAHLVNSTEVTPAVGWRLITVAALANLAFKAGLVGVLGQRSMFLRVGVGFAFTGAVALALLRWGPR